MEPQIPCRIGVKKSKGGKLVLAEWLKNEGLTGIFGGKRGGAGRGTLILDKSVLGKNGQNARKEKRAYENALAKHKLKLKRGMKAEKIREAARSHREAGTGGPRIAVVKQEVGAKRDASLKKKNGQSLRRKQVESVTKGISEVALINRTVQ